MKIISVQELADHLKSSENFQLIDVREPYEVQISSIGGIHIPMAFIHERISEIDTSLPTCVLCKTGKRAEAVANLLETDFGFSEVMVASGGITAYALEIDNSLEVYE
jgi:adenylyltransferase/sulfurtransferase